MIWTMWGGNSPFAGLTSGANAALAAVLREAAATGLAFNHQTGEYWLAGVRSSTFESVSGASMTRASTGYATTLGGVLVPFSAGVLRRTDAGALIEASATNLLLRSQEFNSAEWVKASATVTANTAIAPDGTVTASTLTATAANGEIYQQYSGATSGVSNAGSIFLKRKTGTGQIFTVDPSNARTLVSASINTADWTRVSIVATTVSTTPFMGVRLGTSGDELFVWGAHAENGSRVTSYIPTTTAAATRASDDASIAIAIPAPYTLLGSWTPFDATPGGSGAPAFDYTRAASASQNRAAVYDGGTGLQIVQAEFRNNTTGTANNVTGSAPARPAQRRAAMAVSDGSQRIAVNGLADALGWTFAAPLLQDRLFLTSLGMNANRNATLQWGGILPRALTIAELQAVTA